MNLKQIRWKQRFENFNKSLSALERSININAPSETEKAGIIQFYEITFELAWKTLKDYLEVEGFVVKSPRETIKQAFQIELINAGEDWLDALDDRNLTAHLYDEKSVNEIISKISSKYFPLFVELKNNLDKINNNEKK